MKKCLTFFFILFLNLNAHGSTNQEIINHLEKINSLEFKFIQKIDNNNIEKGECIILYPKRIFLGYKIVHSPFSILLLSIFCINLNSKEFIFSK